MVSLGVLVVKWIILSIISILSHKMLFKRQMIGCYMVQCVDNKPHIYTNHCYIAIEMDRQAYRQSDGQIGRETGVFLLTVFYL